MNTTTPTPPTPFAVKLAKNLHGIEIVFLISLVIGGALAYYQINSSILRLSLIGLALVFFLYAFMPVAIVREEGALLTFSDLLATSILPKVLWISSAISMFGLMIYLDNPGNEGYKQLLLIGGLTTGIGVALLLIFLIAGVKNTKVLTPILLRAVPLLFIDLYILFG